MKKQEQTQFIAMRGQGESYQNIATALNVSKSTCIEWGKKYADEVREARLEYIDDIVKASNVVSVGRLKELSKHLKKISEALAEVDYKKLPPDKLIKIYIDVSNAMRQEAEQSKEQNQDTKAKAFGDLWTEPSPFSE